MFFNRTSLSPSISPSGLSRLSFELEMNCTGILSHRLFLTVVLFFIVFFPTNTLADDPYFNTCIPKRCGDDGPNITYPFWIQGFQSSHCGLPGFNLTCDNNKPVLRMPQNEFEVRNIFYNNQSIVLLNEGYSVDNCPRAVRNLTFDRTPFRPLPSQVVVDFFLHCRGPFPLVQGLYYLQIPCLTNNSHTSYAAINGERVLESMDFVGSCASWVKVPVTEYTNPAFVEPFLWGYSYNELFERGFLMNWEAHDNCDICTSTGGQCGYNWTTSLFSCFCRDRVHKVRCQGTNARKHVKLIRGLIYSAGTSGLVFLLVALSIFMIKKRKFQEWIFFWRNAPDISRYVEAFLDNYGSLSPKRYKYADIKKITTSFKDKLGQGGFGGVYKGKLADGSLVAVKLLSETKGNGEDFMNEVASIGRTSHVNIVTLMGFCSEGSKRALVYEFMANGSLEKFIYADSEAQKSQHLGWEKLYQIAVGIARGLEYLHRGCTTRILHFDIKPHNILLDKDFCPKISDFGMAKLCPTRDSIISMLGTRGTVGYIAPEVFSRNFGGVSYKSDVYSYGMMVLEMVGGRRNIDAECDNTSEIYFPHWIYKRLNHVSLELLFDQEFASDEELIKVRKMILVGIWCIQTNSGNRPSMSRVLEMLEGSLEAIQVPPKPYLSSPPSSPNRQTSSSTSSR